MRQTVLLLLFALLLVSSTAPAQTEVGEVSFANSGSAVAQDPFLRGLALLHNFEYADAAEQFRKAQAADPDFAMAYWGEAMTYNHPVWMQQDLAAARAVLARLGANPEARVAKAKTERERDYLRTVEILYGDGSKEERDFRYSDAMATLHQRYPDDVDATAFYALSLLGTAHQGRDFAIYMKSAALLEEVFPTHQRHPGVLHYLIHSYDDPIHAPLGMRAARLYGGVAPNAGHALHMTSHIFVALGLWDDVIAANERAMKVVDQQRAAHGQGPKACGHYPTWLHYALLQERRFDEAARRLDDCRRMAAAELVSAPASLDPDNSSVGSYVEMRVVQALETGRWDAEPGLNVPAGHAAARFTQSYGEALLAAAASDPAALHAAAGRLRERQKDLLAAVGQAKSSNPADRQRAEIAMRQIEALEKIRDGRKDEGIAILRQAADAESAMAFEFGPPAIEKPTSELLGDELLALGRAAEAEQAYRAALSRTPGRTRSLQGLLRAQQALGKSEAAQVTKAQLARYTR